MCGRYGDSPSFYTVLDGDKSEYVLNFIVGFLIVLNANNFKFRQKLVTCIWLVQEGVRPWCLSDNSEVYH